MSLREPSTLTLHHAVLFAVAIAIVAGIVPAGVALHGRLASALEERARADLALAPRVLEARDGASADAMMMHAKEFAHADGLAEALVRVDRAAVLTLVETHRASLGNMAVVVGPDGASLAGPTIDTTLIAATRGGHMPVGVHRDANGMHRVALAPVQRDGRWVGAAGVAELLNTDAAGVMSGLTRSDVVIMANSDGAVSASTLDAATAKALATAARRAPGATAAFDIVVDGRQRLAVLASLGTSATVIFSRALEDDLAVLPDLRRVALVSALVALLVALALGAWLAARVARPVRQLSDAAVALTDGNFSAPVPTSRIREVARVSATFNDMRLALAARLAELHRANDALTDRNARLTALQADLMQRDRLSATGRLVAQLAHEIRNPVANLRNCLELIRRRVAHDVESREFADLAIDELLRMHELAEQMLDLNRPRDPAMRTCLPVRVAHEVATLSSLGWPAGAVTVESTIPAETVAQMAPDALKQVLLNLVQNAGEATRAHVERAADRAEVVSVALHMADEHVVIDVSDSGTGIATEHLSRIFDPFFTTKEAVHGVGLGLFVAEGLVRTAGGRVTAVNRSVGGACFSIEIPAAVLVSNAESGAFTEEAFA